MSNPTPVWFITAASSGFGKYMALEALSRGHRVIASGRSLNRLQEVAQAGGHIVELDVTSPLVEIEKIAKEANAKYGYITHVVNAAGYILVGAVEETSPKEDYDIFNTNVLGTLNVCKAFTPYLRAGSGHRTLSNFGSIASWYGDAGFALYSGTKWAITGITEGLRPELAPFGIAVTSIEPGYFRTGFLAGSTMVQSEKRIDEYEEGVVGGLRKTLGEIGGKQPGDVVKGSRVLVDVLTMTGSAEGRDVPVRIALGSDAPGAIRGKCESTIKLLGEWDHVITKTDHE